MFLDNNIIIKMLRKKSHEHESKFCEQIKELNSLEFQLTATQSLLTNEMKSSNVNSDLLKNYKAKLNEKKVEIQRIITEKDISEESVISQINEIKTEIKGIENCITKQKLLLEESKEKEYKKRIDDLNNKIRGLENYRNHFQLIESKLINNSIYIEQLKKYQYVLETLQSIFPNIQFEFNIHLEKGFILLNNTILKRNKQTLSLHVKQETHYKIEDYCRGCYMGTESYYLNKFDFIDTSETLYDFFNDINDNDIHFYTLSNEDGETCLISFYIKNPFSNSNEDRYIKFEAKEGNYLTIEFSSKPTNF